MIVEKGYAAWFGAIAGAAFLLSCTQHDAESATAPIDHLVYLTPDLDRGTAAFAERTGVAASYGGAHVKGGTANYLASLGAGAYLEILGPSPGRDLTAKDDGAAIAAGQDELWTFALRVTDVEAAAASLRKQGFDVTGPLDGGREMADGRRLAWRTLAVSDKRFCEIVPFLIEWGEGAAHPSNTSSTGLALARLEITHPDADALNRIFAMLGAGIRAAKSDAPSLRAVLNSPRGEIVLARKTPPCTQ